VGVSKLPLTERVSFKAKLQQRNRFVVSKYVRWRFKLTADQCLQVTVNIIGLWRGPQIFLAKISKDGRIVIPKTNMDLLRNRNSNIAGYVVDVTLEPYLCNKGAEDGFRESVFGESKVE
jgi:hypothetical protein